MMIGKEPWHCTPFGRWVRVELQRTFPVHSAPFSLRWEPRFQLQVVPDVFSLRIAAMFEEAERRLHAER